MSTEQDHDLLIQMNTKLDRAVSDIADLRDNTNARVDKLENEKMDRADAVEMKHAADKLHDSHDRRLSKLEYGFAVAVGAFIIFTMFKEQIIKALSNIN